MGNNTTRFLWAEYIPRKADSPYLPPKLCSGSIVLNVYWLDDPALISAESYGFYAIF